MELIFSFAATKELENLSPEFKAIFFVHLEKIQAVLLANICNMGYLAMQKKRLNRPG